MTAIVRVAVIAVTVALFFATSFNALIGHRDIAIMLALATPLGISAWGFARAGHNEAAIALLCCVLITVVTMILVLNPLGVHDVAITAYGGVVLVSSLLLSRRGFFAILGLTLFGATAAFVAEFTGNSRSVVMGLGGWPQYVDFLLITTVFAILGRYSSEQLFGSLGEAHDASGVDSATGLLNRKAFVNVASSRLKALQSNGGYAVLVMVDLDGFRRINLVIGHEAADHLLGETAKRLLTAAGEGDHVFGRAGDDEFAVLGVGVPEDRAEAFARELHAKLNFDYQGVSVRRGAGYSRFPRDAHGIESLMLSAESGVASAKAREDDRLAGPADRI